VHLRDWLIGELLSIIDNVEMRHSIEFGEEMSEVRVTKAEKIREVFVIQVKRDLLP
jgi:hypothetical protein